MQIGPLPRYFLERAINYLLWGALALAIALHLWVQPLWRDMLALDQGAVAIGRGELDAQVHVSPSSPVRALADTFNSVAQRVRALLKAQKDMTDAGLARAVDADFVPALRCGDARAGHGVARSRAIHAGHPSRYRRA